MSCPEFANLHLEENRFHADGCEACRSLLAMRSLERPNIEACEDVDGLMGLHDALTSIDSKRLESHLSECPACMVAYLGLVADADVLALEPAPWKGPRMEQTLAPHMIRTRTAIVGAVALAAAAVLTLYLLRPPEDSSQGLAAVPMEVHADARTKTAPGASRPAPVPRAPRRSVPSLSASRDFENAQLSELVLASENAIRAGDLSSALTSCSDALVVDPRNDGTLFACALAHCTSVPDRDTANRLIRGMKSESLKRDANALCDEVQSDSEQCDEVTCLVDPNAECCKANGGPSSPERREEVRVAMTTRGVQLSLDVEALAGQAKALAKSERYVEAFAMAEVASMIAPKHQTAHLVGAICACNLGEREAAQTHIDALDGASKRAAIRQICNANGVDL